MIYSLDKIKEMAEGDEDFILSVISVFLEEVPTDLEGLEKAVQEKDHEQIYKLAHKIKPNVDLLGMEQTRACALELETLGKNAANMDQIENKFPQLKKDIVQVIAELQKDFFGDKEILPTNGDIEIITPAAAHNAALIPVTVLFKAPIIEKAKKLHLILDENPAPLAAVFEFGEGFRNKINIGERTITTRLRAEYTSKVRAI